MRHAALGTLLALATLSGCDGGGESTPKKAEEKAPSKRANPETAGAKGEPTVKVVRPEDDKQGEPAAGLQPGLAAENLDQLAVAELGNAYGQILIKTMSEENHLADMTLVRAEGVKPHSGAVRYTAEPRVVVAGAKVTLDESNLLGSGVAVDIDGDGATVSKIKSSCESGTSVLKTDPPIRFEPVTELTDAVARFDYGKDDARILSNDKAGALVYAPCDSGRIVLGLDPSAPLKLHEVPSPAVFVVYRAEVDSIDAEDPFSLQKIDAGETPVDHELYPFREVNVEGDTVKIYAAHLVVFPIDPAVPLQHITVSIAGEKPEFVTASINEVDAE